MTCFDIKAFVTAIKNINHLSQAKIFNDLVFMITNTNIYTKQNPEKSYKDTDPSLVSKILHHKGKLPNHLKDCAKLIELGSEDFNSIKNSFETLLKNIGLNDNPKQIVNTILSEIKCDDILSESDKEMFKVAAKENSAIFLTKVLLYLFSNDPSPENIDSSQMKNDAQESPSECLQSQSTKNKNLSDKESNTTSSENMIDKHQSIITTSVVLHPLNINPIKEEPDPDTNAPEPRQRTEHIQPQISEEKSSPFNDRTSNIIFPDNSLIPKQTTPPISTNCDKAHKRFNIFAIIHNSKEKKFERLYPDEIHLNHYNLFVIGKEEFKEGISLIKSVTDERFTDPDIKEETDTSENLRKDILLKHPSLFIPYDQNTDVSAQLAYIGFVDRYTEEFGNLIIYWHSITKLPVRYIRAWRDRLGLIDIDYDITELDVPHWAVKNSDLFHAIKDFLPDPIPKIPETNALLRTVHLKYNDFNKGVSLEFVYYYYGDNGPHHTKMTKTLQIPMFSNNKTLNKKKTNFIFDKCSIATDLEFTNTLPHISLLTDLLPEMEDKHIPMIKSTPVILGNHLNWHCCELTEEGDHLVVMPSSAQNEADNIDQSIGELIDSILYWANKKRIINKQEAIEQFIYLTY